MKINNSVTLVFALSVAIVAALLARSWLQTHSRVAAAAEPHRTLVVATKLLVFGTPIAPDNVAEVPWAADALPEGAFATREEILSEGRRVVLAPLAVNEPVLRSKITGPGQRASLSSLLQDGYRAVTVRVDDVRGVAGFILPGDFVDVVLIKSDDERIRRENYSEILLQKVKVLAIDQLTSEREEHPTIAKAVTLEVMPEQAQRILLATNIGKLSLILRQPGEQNTTAGRRITEKDLTHSSVAQEIPANHPAPPPVPVPVKAPVLDLDSVKVGIVRTLKRQEYTVRREWPITGADMSAEANDPATVGNAQQQ